MLIEKIKKMRTKIKSKYFHRVLNKINIFQKFRYWNFWILFKTVRDATLNKYLDVNLFDSLSENKTEILYNDAHDHDVKWKNNFPWGGTGELHKNIYTTYFKNGQTVKHPCRLDFFMKLDHKDEDVKFSTCPWLLNLEKEAVQEIDLIETAKVGGKWKHYFSIHSNPNGKYHEDGYAVVQYKIPYLKELYEDFHLYSIKWYKNKVVWLIDDIVVATTRRRVPFQEMYPVITNINLDNLEFITYTNYEKS